MITMGRIGIKSDIGLKTISNMEISIKPNQHIQMILGGILNRSIDEAQSDWEGQDIQVLELDIEGQPKQVIFQGVIKKTYTYVENQVSQIIVTALSSSIKLDQGEKSRSHQDVNKTYGQLVQETVASAGGSVKLHGSDTVQIRKPVIQYMETDWEFCKRMASHMRIPLYCNPTSPGISLQVGIEPGSKPVMEIGQEYQALIKPALPASQPMLSYEVKSYENYRIGDLVKTPTGNMNICEKTVIFGDGELQFSYKLCCMKDIQADVMFNSRIAGLVLEGEVINTAKENVFVKFDIDGHKGEALYPFPWTPITGNIMYCMPEQGAKVGVYFGCSDEKEASAIVVLQRNSCYTISEKRILESKFGKKMQLYPDHLSVKAKSMPEKRLALELIDDKKVNLQSHGYLHMHSSGNIRLEAPYITVETPTELHVSRTSLSAMEEKRRTSGSRNPATGGDNVDSVFTMGYQFDLLSDQGVLCGTEHIKYKDCDDDLTEIKSTFSIGKLVGCVLAGIAVVAAIAIAAAYVTSIVFTGGAMLAAAPLIVGGIAATVGGAAVIAKCIDDCKNQTNSSVIEYLGIAAKGTTLGAVAGFALVASPYAAKWIAQQAILMLPSKFVNITIVNIIYGGAMFTTKGITLSNLVFSCFNMVEEASGVNLLKDFMIACDAENGENIYNASSTASFFASLIIAFLGAYSGNMMRQGGDGGENLNAVDPNKLNHIFGNPEHNFDGFLKMFNGDQTAAYNALLRATEEYVKINNIVGRFQDIVVNVNGFNITVRGNVIDGIVKIGTAFIP